jgi:hypothetical protein
MFLGFRASSGPGTLSMALQNTVEKKEREIREYKREIEELKADKVRMLEELKTLSSCNLHYGNQSFPCSAGLATAVDNHMKTVCRLQEETQLKYDNARQLLARVGSRDVIYSTDPIFDDIDRFLIDGKYS